MTTPIPFSSIIALCAVLLGPAVAGDLVQDYQIVRFAQTGDKLRFGMGGGDGYLGDDWTVTNLTVNPFTLIGVHPDGQHGFRLRNDGWMFFGANPKWTATLRNTATTNETTFSISDNVKKTIRLGTNDYFVVDIRMAAQEVVLMQTNSNALIVFHGVASNRTNGVKQRGP
jgi:hypothetical protein